MAEQCCSSTSPSHSHPHSHPHSHSHGAAVSPAPAAPPTTPAQRLIFATQTGDLSTFQQLEHLGLDLRDEDGVTLAHWAAINNHVVLLRRIIAATPPGFADQPAGNLKATPLLWAVRKGALDAAVLLLEEGGASMEAEDIQGLSCLHAAAIFDHHLLVAYLLAKGAPIDRIDHESGRSALTWACSFSHTSSSTAQILLRAGADPNIKDLEGRTPLHWAVLQGKWDVCVNLLQTPGIDLSIRDKDGKIPADYCPTEPAGSWLMALLRKEKDPNRSNLPQPIKNRISFYLPYVAIPLYLALFSFFPYSTSLPIAVPITYLIYRVAKYFWPVSRLTHTNHLFLGFYYASVWLLIVTFLFGPTWQVSLDLGLEYFLLCIFFMISIPSLYWKVITSTPGFLPKSTIEENRELVLALAKEGKLSEKYYCYTCGIRRPLRSKHDPLCGRCVPRFDHHCIFTQTCIGLENHLIFLTWLAVTIVGQGYVAYLCSIYINQTCELALEEPYWLTSLVLRFTGLELYPQRILYSAWSCAPWTFAVGFWGVLNMTWELALWGFQIWITVFTSQTTNEFWNEKKYDYYWKTSVDQRGQTKRSFVNPFNHGPFRNLIDFVSPSLDYKTIMALPSDEKKQE